MRAGHGAQPGPRSLEQVERQDWLAWYAAYEDPTSNHSRRLSAVRDRIREVLDCAAPGEIRVVSMCAGDGRDLLGAMEDHPRRRDVRARLVELNPHLAGRARRSASGAEVEVVEGDAALTDIYVGAVPADLVLVCGVFGNIPDTAVAGTIAALPQFVTGGGVVVWTRHRREPDLVPSINLWFARQGFELVWLSDKDAGYGVGMHRFTGEPQPLRTGERLFTFTR
jgi:hypothetical protein